MEIGVTSCLDSPLLLRHHYYYVSVVSVLFIGGSLTGRRIPAKATRTRTRISQILDLEWTGHTVLPCFSRGTCLQNN